MEQIGSVKCNMIHEGFITRRNRIRYQDELIHEHQFIPTRLKEQALAICCITCGKRYCHMCGKLLEKEATTEALEFGPDNRY